MVDIKLYIVSQLLDWLVHDQPTDGLSEQVIAPTRAWAIIHNPYVRDDDAIVAAIFEDGELAAYTASFPDMLDGQRIWWASTLYCYPQFAGRGYGMIVVGSLMEAHEPDLTYDRWGAQETVEICNHIGLNTTYTLRYCLKDKSINTTTPKGKLVALLHFMKKSIRPKKLSNVNYSLRYATYIDGEAYLFMKEHRCNDLWLREQEMLNWILTYPMWQGCTLPNRVEKDLEFTANAKSFDYKVVKMYVDGTLQGVYVLRRNGYTLSVIYLYYSQEYRDVVFASIVDHMIIEKPICVSVESKELRDYIQNELQFSRSEEEQISFSIPLGVMIPETYTLQFGDGDSFL